MRAPSTRLVVDASVLIASVFGRSRGAIVVAQRACSLVTTELVLHEATRRIALGLKRPDLIGLLDELAASITIVPVAMLEPLIARCETALREAVASRNGSTRDAHVLALAWSIDADIWTSDRDFAGTGVATWSTPNLMRALAEAA